ncbi:uncharacterized protein LOC116166376 [Photinus pyralis]|uniref:uncharacterized protein LOC116166376 n=1 Tax=Photinus pyralis TaxID=7054 RepID=UPI0012675DF5|nr:uncharacterized protein LOC116166376 [Photinus pyralis]
MEGSKWGHGDLRLLFVDRALSCELHCELSAIYCATYNVVIISLYRSPSGDFDIFSDTLTSMLQSLNHTTGIIIAGDFNVNFNTQDPTALFITNLLATYGFVQTVKEPTRLLNCLDNIFINFSTNDFYTTIMNTRLSDHQGQMLTVSRDSKVRDTQLESKCYRPITKRGNNSLFNMLSNFSWHYLADINLDVKAKFNIFHGNFLDAFSIAFPKRKLSTRKRDSGIKWFTKEIKLLRDRFHFFTDFYNQYKTESLKRIRNTCRAQYRNAIKNAKINACDKVIRNSANPCKMMWTMINNQRNNVKTTNSLNMRADQINKHFISVVEDKVKQPLASAVDSLAIASVKFSDVHFQIKEVTPCKVRDVIKSLKRSNTKDIYGISSCIIKYSIDQLVLPLTKLVNLTLLSGYFPDELKVAQVIPLFKSGDSKDIKNYRPISILPTFSKIYEKIIYNQIADYFESNNLLHQNQYGFRSQRNTISALSKFVNSTLTCFEHGQYSLALFLDLSKAFDSVSHKILLSKLEIMYKFDTNSLKLIHSYLSGRFQHVVYDGVVSDKLPIKRGVPQGSILGPLLFLIYFNDFVQYMQPHADCILYADDSTLTVQRGTLEETLVLKDKLISIASEWCTTNELILNTNKTEKLLQTLKTHSFENPQSVKFLGVYVDGTLNFSMHARYICKKISSNIYVLRRLSNSLSK